MCNVQVASLTSSIAALQEELSKARLNLADAMRQASNREEQHRAAVNDLLSSGAQQLEAIQAQNHHALVAAAAQHAAQLQSVQAAAGTTEQQLKALIAALQGREDDLSKRCSAVQQQLSDKHKEHQADAQAHEARLAEAAAQLAAAQQASGMHLALADSSKELESLSLAIQQRMHQHHQLAEEAARALPAWLPSQLSSAASIGRLGSSAAGLRQHFTQPPGSGDAQLQTQLADLKLQMASQLEDNSFLRQQTAQMQRTLSDLVSLHWSLSAL